jgi:hypothetical protein
MGPDPDVVKPTPPPERRAGEETPGTCWDAEPSPPGPSARRALLVSGPPHASLQQPAPDPRSLVPEGNSRGRGGSERPDLGGVLGLAHLYVRALHTPARGRRRPKSAPAERVSGARRPRTTPCARRGAGSKCADARPKHVQAYGTQQGNGFGRTGGAPFRTSSKAEFRRLMWWSCEPGRARRSGRTASIGWATRSGAGRPMWTGTKGAAPMARSGPVGTG